MVVEAAQANQRNQCKNLLWLSSRRYNRIWHKKAWILMISDEILLKWYDMLLSDFTQVKPDWWPTNTGLELYFLFFLRISIRLST